jgi:hypothetical protein
MDLMKSGRRHQTKIGEIGGRAKFISPNPFYPAIEEGLSMNPSGSREFLLNEATRILFEAPLLHWFLTYSADMWNQAILAGDMSEQVDALPPTSGAAPTVEVLQVEVRGSWSLADAVYIRRLLHERFSQSK